MSTIIGLTPGLNKPRRTTFPTTIPELLEDVFFRLLLLDPYLKDVGGSNPQIVAAQFLDRLDAYKINRTDPRTKILYDILDEASIGDGVGLHFDIAGAADEPPKFTVKPVELLLSGYTPKVGTGHAVCLLIQQQSNDLYSLSIINSGEGLNYHVQADDAEDKKENIIIRYNELSLDEIRRIKYIHSFTKPTRAMKEQRDDCLTWPLPDEDKEEGRQNIKWLGKFWRNFLVQGDPIETMDINVFYKSIQKVLRGKKFEPIYRNYPQFSSSCAVFSLYHYIAYYIFDNVKADFDTFINQVYIYLIDNFVNKIFLPMGSAVNGLSTIVNITHILLKDYPLNPTIRTQIENKLQEIYSNFENTAIGEFEPRGINEFDPVKQVYKTFMESGKTIDDINYVVTKLSTITLQEPDKKMCKDLMLLKCAYIYYKTTENRYKTETRRPPTEIRTSVEFYRLKKILGGYARTETAFAHIDIVKRIILGGFLLMFDDTNIVPKFTVHPNFAYAIHNWMCCEYIYINGTQWPGCTIPIQFNFKFVADMMVKFASFMYNKDPYYIRGKDTFQIDSDCNFGALSVDYLKDLKIVAHEEPVIDAEYQKLSLFVNSINNKHINTDIKIESFYTILRGLFLSFKEPVYYGNTQGIDTCTNLYRYINDYFNQSGVLPNIRKGLFIDAIENALAQLDKVVFLETIRSINGDMVETILFFLYIFDRNFIITNKQTIIDALEPESYILSIMNDNLYTEYSKIFSENVAVKGPSIFLALFITVFVDADYEADKRFIENVSVPNKNVLGQGYTVVMGEEINYKFDNYAIYKKIDEAYEYECVHPQGKRFTINQIHRITREFDAKEYYLQEGMSSFIDIEKLIINKLDLSKENYKIWIGKEDTIIDLDDHVNSRIQFSTNGDITFIDKNGISYKIITDYSALNGIWAFNMTNCLLLSNNNKYYVLVLLNNEYILSKLAKKDFYWYDYSEAIYSLVKSNYTCLSGVDHQQFIMEIHYTGLSVLATTYEGIAGLFLSLHLANNLHGLDLMFPTIRNTFLNAPQNTIYNFHNMIKSMDMPLWPIYEDLRIGNGRDFGSRFQAEVRDDYFSRSIIDSQHIFVVKPNQKFSLIQDLSNELYAHRKNLLEEAERNADIIDSLSKTYRDFLGKFRHICEPDMCGEDKTLVTKIVKTAYNKKNITDMPNRIFNSMLYKNRQFQDISTLYELFFEYFYDRVIDNLFVLMFAEFKTLIEEDCDLINCGRILKAIEFLDERNIYPLNQQRGIQDVLFELHKGLFLRCDQKNTLEDIYRTCLSPKTTTTLVPARVDLQKLLGKKIELQNLLKELEVNEERLKREILRPRGDLVASATRRELYKDMNKLKEEDEAQGIMYRQIMRELEKIEMKERMEATLAELAASRAKHEAAVRKEERYRRKKELACAKDPLEASCSIIGGGCDLVENPSKSGKTAYEILMGRGKTSTLTPMLLLYSHLHTQNHFYNVVLPSTLVQQSYKIIFELSNLLYNIKIFKPTVDDYSILYNNVIQILSDSTLKIITLDTLTKLSSDRRDSFFIFDEIDTLLNPLKSYLNRPFSTPILHPNMTALVNTLCDFLLNSTDIKLLDQYINKWSEDAAFKKVLSTKLHTTMNQALFMKHNQTYGFGTNSATEIITFDTLMANASYFKSIPYSANKTPVEGSEFSDFELALVLTILTYKQTKLRTADIVLILEVIKEELRPIKQFSEDIVIMSIKEKFTSLVKVIAAEELLRIVNSIKMDKKYIEECEKIAGLINGSESTLKDVLLFYFKKVIFAKLFKIHSEQQNISTVDLFDPSICTSHVSFSGTVNFHMPAELIRDSVSVADVPDEYTEGQITNIVSDEAVGAAIEAAFYGRTVGRKPEIIIYKPSLEAEQELISYVSTNISKYNSLIDCAGLILNHSPEEIIDTFSKATPDRTFIYIDNKDEKMVRINGATSKYNDKIINNVFIYYDHKHCVGADVKQPNKMHGLVTLSDENTLTEASQAIFRLRNINVGHSIDFFCSQVTTPDQPNKYKQLAKLYTELKERDRRFKDNTKEDAQLQCIKYLDRHLKKYNPRMYRKAFNEALFYDTKPYGEEYLTYDEFLQTQIKTYTQNIPLKDFTINKRNLAAIQVEVVQEEEIVQQTVTKVETKFNQLANLTRKILKKISVPVTAYCDIISSQVDPTIPINSLDGFTYEHLLQLPSANWILYLSPEIYYCLVGCMYIELKHLDITKHPNRNNGVSGTEGYYMMHNTNVPDRSLLITYSEYIVLSTCKACPSTVSIYDLYGKCILGSPISFHPFIELLCFKKNFSIMDTFTILMNSSYGDIRKFKYYQYILKRFYTFNVDIELKEKLNPANLSHWSFLYNLPTGETEFLRKIVQDYSEHADTKVDSFYKSKPPMALPSFEEDIAAEIERQTLVSLFKNNDEHHSIAETDNNETDNNDRTHVDKADNNDRTHVDKADNNDRTHVDKADNNDRTHVNKADNNLSEEEENVQRGRENKAAWAGPELRLPDDPLAGGRRVPTTYKLATNETGRKTRKRRQFKSLITHIRSTGVKGIGVRTRPGKSRLQKKQTKLHTRRAPKF